MRKPVIHTDFLRFFLPITAIVALSILISAVVLSTLFMNQASLILQEQEMERLQGAMRIFSRIQLDSIPAYVDAIETGPIRDYLYGRDWSKEKTLRALENLDRTLIGNDFIDSFYLYNYSSGILSTRAGWEGLESKSDPTLMTFLFRIHDYGLTQYVMRRVQFANDTGPSNLFTVVLGVMPPKGSMIRYAFVANLSERKIRQAIAGDGTSASVMYIVDKDRRFLSHPDSTRFGSPVEKTDQLLEVLDNHHTKGMMIIKDEKGRRFIASWIDHPEIQWRFITLTPERLVFAPVVRVRDRVVIFVILVLMAAIFMSYTLSIKMSLRERRSKLAVSYLKGEIDAESGDKVQTSFPGLRAPIRIAIVIVEEGRQTRKPNSDIFDMEFVLKDAMEAPYGKTIVLRLADNQYIVLFKDTNQKIASTFQSFLSALSETWKIGLGAFLLDRALTVEGLPEGYRILKNAVRLEYTRPSGAVILVSQKDEKIDQIVANSTVTDLDISSLEKVFRLDNPDEANHRIEKLIDDLRKAQDPDIFRYTVSTLACRIPLALGDDAEALICGGVDKFKHDLSRAERLDEAERILRTATVKLKERGELHGERRKKELIQRIKNIIEERLGDKTLGTSAIASEVGLSSSYLRDIFKKYEGQSLLEYLGNRRIEVAKKLILETQESVKSVCDKAGFINYSYFFTYFKKITGFTPTEYRQKKP